MELWLVLTITLIVVFLAWDFKRKNMSSIPGFFAWPVVGSLPATLPYVRDNLKLHDIAIARFGDTYKFWGLGFINPLNAIVTSKPENAKHFLVTNFENYERSSAVPRFSKLFGNGIFNSNGDNWKFHRHTSRALFTNTSVAEMMPDFISHGHKVLEHLQRAADDSSVIDFQDLLFRFTLDSICTIGFGLSIHSLDSDVPFSEAFNRSQETISVNGRNPILRLLPDKQFDADYKLMADFITKIVRDRRAAEDYSHRTDLLSRFMVMKDDNGNPFSEEYLRDMVLNFFIAGRDTTACLMAWTFYLLAKNPEVESKLIALIDEVIGDAEPTVELLDSKEMRYLRNVLDETLRIYPSVPFDLRRAKAADVLPDGTPVAKGDGLVYSALLMGRSEKLWDQPERYMPERWEDRKSINKDAFLAFHAGPQTCLGRPMAYLEAKTLIVLILQKYTLRLAPGHDVQPKVFIVMPVKDGLHVTVHPRVKD